jgi:hypothetical protein
MQPDLTIAALNDETAERLNDVEITAANAGLDALVLANDKKMATHHLVARLVSLNPIERAREIRAAAKELGVPIAAVQEAIKEVAPTTDTKGQGRPLELPEIEPWPDTVEGARLLMSASRRELGATDPRPSRATFWRTSTKHSLAT